MTIDGFITFLGLLIALVALASPPTRRALLVRWRWAAAASFAAIAVVLYLLFFNVLAPPCEVGQAWCRPLVLNRADGEGLTTGQVAFAVVMIWLVLMTLNVLRRDLGARHLPAWSQLLSALVGERRFSDVARLVEHHTDLVGKDAEKQFAGSAAKRAIGDIRTILFKRTDLMRFLALERPGLTVGLLRSEHVLVFEFADRVLSELMRHPDGPLFAEMANLDEQGPDAGYHFPHHPYLGFLCGEAANAARLGAWDPVMQTAIAAFVAEPGNTYPASLNSTASGFEQARHQDRTYVAIRFFDLMVDGAMRQGVVSHMWVPYMRHLLTPLLETYDENGPGVNSFDEHPTRGGYLIYSIFSALLRWVNVAERLPDGAYHKGAVTADLAHNDDIIPKVAILTLGDCARRLLLAETISERFKAYIIEDVMLQDIKRMSRDGPLGIHRQALIASLLAGGNLDKSDHLDALRQIWEGADFILRDWTKDFGEALEAAEARRDAARARVPRGRRPPL